MIIMTTTKISAYETTGESKIVCVVNDVDYFTFNNQLPTPGNIRENLLERIRCMQGMMTRFRNIEFVSIIGNKERIRALRRLGVLAE